MGDRCMSQPAVWLASALLALPSVGLCEQKAAAQAKSVDAVPALLGYGMKSCGAFVAAAPRNGTPEGVVDEEYVRYREWLSGFVTGLNLATGRDVLQGAEIDAALIRIRASCQDHPGDDFFNASLRLVRSLGQVGKK